MITAPFVTTARHQELSVHQWVLPDVRAHPSAYVTHGDALIRSYVHWILEAQSLVGELSRVLRCRLEQLEHTRVGDWLLDQ